MKSGDLRKRLCAWLFVLTLLVSALPSGACWQCLNGTPCPPHCLPAQQSRVMHCGMASPVPACPKCRAAVTALDPSPVAEHCPSSQCVLRMRATPSAALLHKSAFLLAFLALPAADQDFPPPAAEIVTVSFPHPLVLYQQQYWRPYVGRAPPVLL